MAAYVDPTDPGAWAEAVLGLLTDPARRDRAVGRARTYPAPTWAGTAALVTDLLVQAPLTVGATAQGATEGDGSVPGRGSGPPGRV